MPPRILGFFQRAGFKGRMPAVVACGSRNDTYYDYCTAIANAGQNDFPVLLVDSESAVTREPWDHLRDRDGWRRPTESLGEHAQLMVQCMEAWFLADRGLLARFFGQGFSEGALPGNQDVEAVSKGDLFRGAPSGNAAEQNEGRIWQAGALVRASRPTRPDESSIRIAPCSKVATNAGRALRPLIRSPVSSRPVGPQPRLHALARALFFCCRANSRAAR